MKAPPSSANRGWTANKPTQTMTGQTRITSRPTRAAHCTANTERALTPTQHTKRPLQAATSRQQATTPPLKDGPAVRPSYTGNRFTLGAQLQSRAAHSSAPHSDDSKGRKGAKHTGKRHTGGNTAGLKHGVSLSAPTFSKQKQETRKQLGAVSPLDTPRRRLANLSRSTRSVQCIVGETGTGATHETWCPHHHTHTQWGRSWCADNELGLVTRPGPLPRTRGDHCFVGSSLVSVCLGRAFQLFQVRFHGRGEGLECSHVCWSAPTTGRR